MEAHPTTTVSPAPLLRLVWRNLWAHKTRTWLLVVAGVLSLLIPAQRVLKLKPVEAMRST